MIAESIVIQPTRTLQKFESDTLSHSVAEQRVMFRK